MKKKSSVEKQINNKNKDNFTLALARISGDE